MGKIKAIDSYAFAHLLGSLMILISGILAFYLHKEIDHISEPSVATEMRQRLVQLKPESSDTEKLEQLESIKWNHLASRLEPVYEYVRRKSIVDQFSEHPSLFYMATIGGFLVILSETKDLFRYAHASSSDSQRNHRQRNRRR